ncbi:MAG TPA: MMPL family transporter [Solirubrobacteraceae bacterium]|nr:MMPL family transporter [Solirubrobacteraceae bacterium]
MRGAGPATRAPGIIATVGAWSARHRRLVLAAWLVLLVGATVASNALGGVFSDTLTIPNSQAQAGLNILRAHERRAGGQNGQLVFVDPHARLSTQRAAIEQTVSRVAHLPHVLSVSDPLRPGTVSRDGRTAYASVNFDTNPQSLGGAYITSVDTATAPARHAGVAVQYGGALGQAAAPKANDGLSELIGIAVALVVLLAGFGSVIAAGLPLVSAILGVFSGLGLLGMLAAAVTFGKSSPTLALMMGLGVGIDYALFLTTRYRQLLIEGDDPDRAIRRTLAASGRSVAIAATTVVIAMLGLYVSGITFIGKLGLAAALSVAVTALASLTLVPALLGFARQRIDRWHVRSPVAEPATDTGPLHRYTETVARHPWRFALGATALLLVIAIPTLSMHIGHVGPGAEPASWSERQAYDSISRGFGPGATGPLTIVAKLPAHTTAQTSTSLARSLRRAVQGTPGVASAGPLTSSPDGAVLVGRAIPTTGPTAQATQSLVAHLQNDVLPSVLRGAHATGYVTGTAAATIDFQTTVASRLPLIIGVVVAAAFLLLLAFFRSPVVALKAALLNLLSIAAAYGVIVAVFQWGWGASALGVSGPVPIESYVPMIIFAIVFGLSMDYEVFLVSRIREYWLLTGDNRRSVAMGLSRTARVITCAALIMASVFFAFLLSTNVVIKMLALGLGASVIIDATIIRMVIVPALMFLFDRANWWSPGWLDRLLPHLEPDTEPAGAGGGPAADGEPALATR